jgi:hypothetical protein
MRIRVSPGCKIFEELKSRPKVFHGVAEDCAWVCDLVSSPDGEM